MQADPDIGLMTARYKPAVDMLQVVLFASFQITISDYCQKNGTIRHSDRGPGFQRHCL